MSVMSNGIKEGKEIIEAGSDQASFQLDIVKKKLKIYGLQKKIEIEMAKLGEIIYNLSQIKGKDIQNNKQIADMVESIKEQKEEIENTEQEITDIQNNSEGAKEKLYCSGKNLFEKIKKSWGTISHTTNETDTQPLEQKGPDIEKKQETKTKEHWSEKIDI